MALSEEQKKVIEKILKYYFSGKLKSKYRSEKRRGEHNYHPSSTGNVKVSRDRGGHGSDEIERFIEQKDQSEQLARFLKLFIDEVEEALKSLSRDNRYLLKLSYSNKPNYTDGDIGEQLEEEVSKWTVSRRRKDLLEEVYKLIDIGYYLDNPIKEIADFFENFLL